ncbi:hypothetical protein DNTS_030898 [Danionella cerebrum]|uniref:Uncharacterized protein n=1 Tax=Danionella cerebrum TaxID=2873325 RepID=A0A553Q8H7_9TELE|nr:hypothetical protein DNTS_030898 [Danionella translucida]
MVPEVSAGCEGIHGMLEKWNSSGRRLDEQTPGSIPYPVFTAGCRICHSLPAAMYEGIAYVPQLMHLDQAKDIYQMSSKQGSVSVETQGSDNHPSLRENRVTAGVIPHNRTRPDWTGTEESRRPSLVAVADLRW